MKRKRLTEEDLLNKWLGDYHSTSIEQVKKDHPEWDEDKVKAKWKKEYPEWEEDRINKVWELIQNWISRDFYRAYAVTQAQHDEWDKWLIKALAKEHRCSQRYVRRAYWAIYLNTSPSVKEL